MFFGDIFYFQTYNKIEEMTIFTKKNCYDKKKIKKLAFP